MILVDCAICGSKRCLEIASCADPRGLTDQVFKVVRCLECGFHFLNPRPEIDEMGKYYPAGYYSNRRQVRTGRAGNRKRAVRWLYHSFDRWNNRKNRRDDERKNGIVERYHPEGTILDIGCGEGAFLALLPKEKWERHGVDFSERAIEEARKQDIENLHLGDPSNLDLPKDYFDVITLWHVLEHVYYPMALLRKIHFLLKVGGHVILTVPNLKSMEMKLFRRHFNASWEAPRHLSHFDTKSVSVLLETAGFKIDEINFRTMAPVSSLFEEVLKKTILSILHRLGFRYVRADQGSPLRHKIASNLYTFSLYTATVLSNMAGRNLALAAALMGTGHAITLVCHRK